jgi:hypothetical protein
VERLSQEPLYWCSHWRASAYVGGPNLLTWEDIYQFFLTKTQDLYYYAVMRYTFSLNSYTDYYALEEEAGALRHANIPI